MHPVFSDIEVANIESRTRAQLESRQRIDLARQGSPRRPAISRLAGVAARLAGALHQVLDPRGSALSELAASPEARVKPMIESVRNGSGKGAEVSRVEDISRHTAGSPVRPITTIPPEGRVA
jgi:hypothetical protein